MCSKAEIRLINLAYTCATHSTTLQMLHFKSKPHALQFSLRRIPYMQMLASCQLTSPHEMGHTGNAQTEHVLKSMVGLKANKLILADYGHKQGAQRHFAAHSERSAT